MITVKALDGENAGLGSGERPAAQPTLQKRKSVLLQQVDLAKALMMDAAKEVTATTATAVTAVKDHLTLEDVKHRNHLDLASKKDEMLEIFGELDVNHDGWLT